MGNGGISYNDHGIEYLFSKDTIPWYSLADVEFIFGISRLQARDLLRGEPSIDIGSESLFCLLNGEQERVLRELSHQGFGLYYM